MTRLSLFSSVKGFLSTLLTVFRSKRDPGIPWGGLRVPRSQAILHFLLLGQLRSGKSLSLKAVIRYALERGDSALVYDASADIIPELTRYATDQNPLVNLNPFDSRCHYWSISSDVTSDEDAQAFARALIPAAARGSSGNDEFFRNSAVRVLSSVVSVLARRQADNDSCKWNLRDVVTVSLDLELLRPLLAQYSDTRGALAHLQEKALSDVMATVHASVQDIIGAAAAFDFVEHSDPDRSFSFDSWSKEGSGIVVLSTNEKSPSPLVALNRVLFERASGALLSRTQRFNQTDGAKLTWLFIDEAALLGSALPRLGECITRGGKYGVATVLATQSVEDFYQAYGGPDPGDGILGQPHHRAAFKCSYRTSEWCAQQFGQHQRHRVSISHSHGESSQDSVSIQPAREYRVPPEAIQSLPVVSKGRPLIGFYQAPSFQSGLVFRQRLPWKHIIGLQPRTDPTTECLVKMPSQALRIRPFTAEDTSRLGIVANAADVLDSILDRRFSRDR